MIEKLINDTLLKEQEDRKSRKRSGRWNPSSFGKCYRAQYWNRKNEPVTNPPDARNLRVFKAGKLFHDFVQGYIPNQEKEVICDKDDIFGYADIVTTDSVIDLKSQHSKAFWYMEKNTYDITEEKKTNWLQVACYAWILGKKWCKLCFISKDDLCIKEYAMPTEKWIPKVEAELDKLRLAWNLDKLPSAQPRCYNGKECKYCGFTDKCKEIENANINPDNTGTGNPTLSDSPAK